MEGGGETCLSSGRGKRSIEPEEFLLVIFRGDFEHRYADYSGCHFPRLLLLSALLWVGGLERKLGVWSEWVSGYSE